MKTDYLQAFPLPAHLLPTRLRALLEPVGEEREVRVDVAMRFEYDPHGLGREYVHMLMAVIPEAEAHGTDVLRESQSGVVEEGTPDFADKGAMAGWAPSVSGFGYIVACWGDNQRYAYALSERVWMMLGLVPRVFGNQTQKIAYDDLSVPEFDIAEGELSSTYHFVSSRDVHWTMSNAHLRRYLWLNNAIGTRVFFYEGFLSNSPDVLALMKGRPIIELDDTPNWCRIVLRHHRGRILLQVWGTVAAVAPVRLATPSAEALS